MDAGSITQAISLLALLILMSAFFSAAQTAFTDLSKTRLKNLAATGSKNATLALKLSEKYDSLQLTLITGKTVLTILSTILSMILFQHLYSKHGIVLAMAVVAISILIFAEVTPITLANDSPEKFAMFASPVLRVLVFFLTPFHLVFHVWKELLHHVFRADDSGKITEEELITIVEDAQSEGGIDEHESELIRSAIEFNDLEVESILTPRVDIVAASDTISPEELADIFRNNGFSRLPVYTDTIDNIIGIIHEKDFNRLMYEGGTELSSIIHEVVFITESMKISKLLRLFQETKVHMAIVVDEFGGTAGIITLEDVLEGLVGDIWDEHDEVVNDITQLDETTFLVSCGASFDLLSELFDIPEEEDTCATVGAWVLNKLSKIPEVGDKFEFNTLHVEVTKIDGRRAVEIKITVATSEQHSVSEEG